MQNYEIPFQIGEFPTFRRDQAVARGVEKNLLFGVWGTLSQKICAEPTLRYVLDQWGREQVSLVTDTPELYTHLNFKTVYDLRIEKPFWNDYYVFELYRDDKSLVAQFVDEQSVHSVDFPSLCALKRQLPMAYRQIALPVQSPANRPDLDEISRSVENFVIVHGGKEDMAGYFPSGWWDSVTGEIIKLGKTPILMGQDGIPGMEAIGNPRSGTIDLRNKLSLAECIWLVQKIPVVVCNESAMIHLAASGAAWIGAMATVRHPDYLAHWRNGRWGWRFVNLSHGGQWSRYQDLPGKERQPFVGSTHDLEAMKAWLPAPERVARLLKEKFDELD